MRRERRLPKAAAITGAVALALAALPLQAQDTAVVRTPAPVVVAPGSVRGVVYDSLARAPLPFATVQVVSAPGDSNEFRHNTRADARGQYRIDRVVPGRYLVSFAHPLLDSLGLEAPVRRADVRERRETRADLATPSARRVMMTLCPAGTVNDSTSLLLGHVRDAATLAVRSAGAVLLTWSEMVIGGGPVEHTRPGVRAIANATGWFAVCNLPTDISLLARAAHGADTSGAVMIELAAGALTRRDMYVGQSVADVGSSAAAGDAAALPGEDLRSGAGQLRGTVRASSGRPVAGARVRVWGSAASVTTGDSGTFALTRLPGGSQTVDVRALGFVPVQQAVDILTGSATNQIDISLVSLSQYLDTVRVMASTPFQRDVNGFLSRQKASIGRFLTREDIARQPATGVTDLLATLPGVQRVWSGLGNSITLRSSFGAPCSPVVFLDRIRLDSYEIDMSVWPKEIDGIEVYTRASQVPAEFKGMQDCGAIVVWTDRVRARSRPSRPKPQ